MEDILEETEAKQYFRERFKEMSPRALPYFINAYSVYSLDNNRDCHYERLNLAFEDTIQAEKNKSYVEIPAWAYHVY
jgi:hypothetical protein